MHAYIILYSVFQKRSPIIVQKKNPNFGPQKHIPYIKYKSHDMFTISNHKCQNFLTVH